jgi:hypothetical protein
LAEILGFLEVSMGVRRVVVVMTVGATTMVAVVAVAKSKKPVNHSGNPRTAPIQRHRQPRTQLKNHLQLRKTRGACPKLPLLPLLLLLPLPLLRPLLPLQLPRPATPASKPQAAAAAAAAANKKGKGKKGKGKKVMIEEVPDDDDKNDNIEPLPVDSKVIFVEASGEPDDSPVHHHQQLLESSMGSSFGDEGSEDKESAFGGAASGSQSDSAFGGGGEQGWGGGGGGAGFGFGWGAGAANAKPAAVWNHSAATDNESSQGGPIWGRTSTPTSQSKPQTPIWGQMGGKDNAKGKGKMADAEQQQQQGSSKIVNPNLKRKPAAGGNGFDLIVVVFLSVSFFFRRFRCFDVSVFLSPRFRSILSCLLCRICCLLSEFFLSSCPPTIDDIISYHIITFLTYPPRNPGSLLYTFSILFCSVVIVIEHL